MYVYIYIYMYIQIGAMKASLSCFELSISALETLTSESDTTKPQLMDDISCQVNLTKGLMLFGQDQVCLSFRFISNYTSFSQSICFPGEKPYEALISFRHLKSPILFPTFMIDTIVITDIFAIIKNYTTKNYLIFFLFI
jgi:hypothetical protein